MHKSKIICVLKHTGNYLPKIHLLMVNFSDSDTSFFAKVELQMDQGIQRIEG